MIFDIKMDDFSRKSQQVAGGHMTEAPDIMTYASVVSRETAHIAPAITALDGLQVKAAGIMNAYITTRSRKRFGQSSAPNLAAMQGRR